MWGEIGNNFLLTFHVEDILSIRLEGQSDLPYKGRKKTNYFGVQFAKLIDMKSRSILKSDWGLQ